MIVDLPKHYVRPPLEKFLRTPLLDDQNNEYNRACKIALLSAVFLETNKHQNLMRLRCPMEITQQIHPLMLNPLYPQICLQCFWMFLANVRSVWSIYDQHICHIAVIVSGTSGSRDLRLPQPHPVGGCTLQSQGYNATIILVE